MPSQRALRYGDRPPRLASMHFNDGPLFLSELPDTPTRSTTPTSTSSSRSTSCSISSINSIRTISHPIDLRQPCWPSAPPPVPATPAEDSVFSDSLSIHSLRRLRPRRLKSIFFHRKAASEGVQETLSSFTSTASSSCSSSFTSQDEVDCPAPPALHPKKSLSTIRSRKFLPPPTPPPTCPLPPLPIPKRKQASPVPCTPCYYFVARNCHGYVLGGIGEDACDHCAAAGFLGAL